MDGQGKGQTYYDVQVHVDVHDICDPPDEPGSDREGSGVKRTIIESAVTGNWRNLGDVQRESGFQFPIVGKGSKALRSNDH